MKKRYKYIFSSSGHCLGYVESNPSWVGLKKVLFGLIGVGVVAMSVYFICSIPTIF
jgi:hypothetical protein